MSVREGYKATEIGIIPKDWEVVQTGEVTIVGAGTGFKEKFQGFTDKEIPFYKVSDMNITGNEVQMNVANNYVNRSELKDLKAKTFQSGALIFPKVGAALRTNKRRMLSREACVDNNVMVLTPIEDRIDSMFLYSQYLQIDFNTLSNAGALPSLNGSQVKKIKFALPPLKEQKKIAYIVSTVDQKIDLIETQIKETKALKKGLMQKLLTEGIGHTEFQDSDIGQIPSGWETVPLPELAKKITSGGTPSRKKPEYFENGMIKWIKTGELRDCYIYDSEEKITEEALKNSSAKLFPQDTLLIAMYGATIGQTAYLKTECSTNQACCAIMFNEKIADPHFYWKYFFFIKENLISMGAGAGQPNISQGIIKSLLMPKPPLEEQKKIADILSTIDNKIETLRAKKESFQTLKKGLMQKLLTGEVRVSV